ncbi:hypothetical protein [Pseudogulbenkiania sp. MAI-1]|uniref:hypothetical protein n=1 Tax=Pseudogulbenkiania sp. MAI-1 TaxID=990370 RepID=UPI0018DE281B|nr:hypothetical protein [Pseudogulbenkiania sp. MAI-1]
MAYTLWKQRGIPLPWPSTTIEWNEREQGKGLPEHDIGEIGRRVEAVLAVQGKIPRNRDARMTAYARAAAAINLIGPHLFPLVVFAEEPLAGSRPLPPVSGIASLRAERYGVTGVADVLTNISLSQVPTNNLLRVAIERELKLQGVALPPEFEVIVDYKGAARPDIGYEQKDYWQQHDWQIQMYAWLRARKAETKPVVAGVVLYVNELLPSTTDVIGLRSQIRGGKSDVVPERGSEDYYVLQTARAGSDARSELSESFRIQRALRVIPVTPTSMQAAGQAFDHVVLDIEQRISSEIALGDISHVWQPSCQDTSTCIACDFRYFCPQPAGKDASYVIEPPPVP